MKGTIYRASISVLITLYAFRVINFDLFVKLFCSVYLLIVLIVLIYLSTTGQLYLNFKQTEVSNRLHRQVVNYVIFVHTGIVVNRIALDQYKGKRPANSRHNS